MVHLEVTVESVQELFTTMVGCSAQPGAWTDGFEVPRGDGHVVSVIGLTGPPHATVALAFPDATLLKVVSALLGMDLPELDAEVAQGAAELANIVAGGTKARLDARSGMSLKMGLPTVLAGRDLSLLHPSPELWSGVPFTTELGNFTVGFALETGAEESHA